MVTHERYVIGTWVRTYDERVGLQNIPSLSIDHSGLLGISDATDQSDTLIAHGHQCVFRVTCTDKQLAALEADTRYTVFPVEGEVTTQELGELEKHDERVKMLPAGVKRAQVKDILVAEFRLQGIKELADRELAEAIASEERQKPNA